MYRYDEHHINNAYLMEIQAEGFDGPSNIVKNILGHPGKLKIVSISKL